MNDFEYELKVMTMLLVFSTILVIIIGCLLLTKERKYIKIDNVAVNNNENVENNLTYMFYSYQDYLTEYEETNNIDLIKTINKIAERYNNYYKQYSGSLNKLFPKELMIIE